MFEECDTVRSLVTRVAAYIIRCAEMRIGYDCEAARMGREFRRLAQFDCSLTEPVTEVHKMIARRFCHNFAESLDFSGALDYLEYMYMNWT